MRRLYALLDWAMSKFKCGEREVLKSYALGRPFRGDAEGAHQLAGAFARRIRGRSADYAEGLQAMNEFCFFT